MELICRGRTLRYASIERISARNIAARRIGLRESIFKGIKLLKKVNAAT